MYDAITRRDTTFVGVFFTAVKTTGIFCRPGCGAKLPRRQNVEFFATAKEALFAGYRPCLRCRPMDPAGQRPPWFDRVLAATQQSDQPRLKAADLRRLKVHPATVARWFKSNYGMTFQAYQRARRVGLALRRIREGATVTTAAMKSGYQSESGLREAFVSVFGGGGEAPRAAAKNGAAPLLAKWLTTPLGPLLAVASDRALMFLEFIDRRALETQVAVLRRRTRRPVIPGDNAILQKTTRELDLYFAGRLRDFTVPLDAPGSPFQQQVWAQLHTIPFGQTRSYAQQAAAINRPSATRAVASANGDNRIAIIIPCHRVIGKDGTMTGYGGGLWRKEWLLKHEGVLLGPQMAK
jgi:AraC family transcriptional regulator, regulatory protein of adaptative response / methylated-DNA-[protein]-cysteine methyltransferase